VPTLPWTECRYRPSNGESLHVLTSTLPLQSYRDVPRFLRWTLRIRKQLSKAEGAVGYSLDARMLRKTFYTLSAWSSAEAMNRFVHSGDHASMLADMAGRLGQPVFVESNASPAELPLDWDEAKQRLADERARSS
jgi:hypothetical protein